MDLNYRDYYYNLRKATKLIEKRRPKHIMKVTLDFKMTFFDDVDEVTKNVVCNPFVSQSLTVVNKTGLMFDDNIFLNISKLGSIGSRQLHEFIQ